MVDAGINLRSDVYFVIPFPIRGGTYYGKLSGGVNYGTWPQNYFNQRNF